MNRPAWMTDEWLLDRRLQRCLIGDTFTDDELLPGWVIVRTGEQAYICVAPYARSTAFLFRRAISTVAGAQEAREALVKWLLEGDIEARYCVETVPLALAMLLELMQRGEHRLVAAIVKQVKPPPQQMILFPELEEAA